MDEQKAKARADMIEHIATLLRPTLFPFERDKDVIEDNSAICRKVSEAAVDEFLRQLHSRGRK